MTEIPNVAPDFERDAVILKQPGESRTAGTVGILAGEAGRFTQFALCIQAVGFQMPVGTSIKWSLGSDISESRNQLAEEITGDWLWFVDDDHGFAPDVLHRLLDRDVDIVAPICLRRQSPFLPVPTGLDGNFLDLQKHEPDELVQVLYSGTSGMLIRRRVFEALEQPYFELGEREGSGNRVSEDVNFCRKAAEAGFQIHVDLSARFGHMTVATIWPEWDEDKGCWGTGFTIADGAQLHINAAEIPPLPE